MESCDDACTDLGGCNVEGMRQISSNNEMEFAVLAAGGNECTLYLNPDNAAMPAQQKTGCYYGTAKTTCDATIDQDFTRRLCCCGDKANCPVADDS